MVNSSVCYKKVHITVLVILCQLFTFETLWFNAYKFNFSCIQSLPLTLLKDVNKKCSHTIRKAYYFKISGTWLKILF